MPYVQRVLSPSSSVPPILFLPYPVPFSLGALGTGSIAEVFDYWAHASAIDIGEAMTAPDNFETQAQVWGSSRGVPWHLPWHRLAIINMPSSNHTMPVLYNTLSLIQPPFGKPPRAFWELRGAVQRSSIDRSAIWQIAPAAVRAIMLHRSGRQFRNRLARIGNSEALDVCSPSRPPRSCRGGCCLLYCAIPCDELFCAVHTLTVATSIIC